MSKQMIQMSVEGLKTYLLANKHSLIESVDVEEGSVELKLSNGMSLQIGNSLARIRVPEVPENIEVAYPVRTSDIFMSEEGRDIFPCCSGHYTYVREISFRICPSGRESFRFLIEEISSDPFPTLRL